MLGSFFMKTYRDQVDIRLQADAEIVVLLIEGKAVIFSRGEWSLLIGKPDVVSPHFRRVE